MAITAGRASSGFQTFADAEWTTLFDASTHGGSCRIAEVFAQTDAVEVRVTGKPSIHNLADGTLATHKIAAGSSQPFKASVGITKIEARRVSASSEAAWTVVES